MKTHYQFFFVKILSDQSKIVPERRHNFYNIRENSGGNRGCVRRALADPVRSRQLICLLSDRRTGRSFLQERVVGQADALKRKKN